MEILKKSDKYLYPRSMFNFLKNYLDDTKDTDILFDKNGEVVICGDFAQQYEILVFMERKELECDVFVNDGFDINAYTARTIDLTDFLEVNLGYAFNEDENPANISAWTSEIRRLL